MADDLLPKPEPKEIDEKLAYCWHPKLRILVGGNWWCQWWEKTEE